MHEPREQWVQNWPGQVVLCVSQIYWTSYVHASLETAGPSLRDFYNSLQVRQSSLLVICLDNSDNMLQGVFFYPSYVRYISTNWGAENAGHENDGPSSDA